MPEVG